MSFIAALLSRLVYYILWAIGIAILARVITDFLLPEDDSALTAVIYVITEPFLLPCRVIIDRIGLGSDMFDFSPMMATVILAVAMALIPSV